MLIEGKISGIDCVLLARHGRKHSIMPSNINYRANIWALKNIGCTHVLVSTATGSLQEHIKPGDLVILDNFIDRTTKRHQTFYDGKELSPVGVCHLPMEPAFCEKMRDVVIKTACDLGEYDTEVIYIYIYYSILISLETGIPVHDRGTVVAIEGPRFSSKAESLMFKQWGGDVINMTTVPEVVLAKEAGLCYAAIAIATDYDCWRSTGPKVCVADVLATFKNNVNKVLQILQTTVVNIAKEDWTQTINELNKTVVESVMLPHN